MSASLSSLHTRGQRALRSGDVATALPILQQAALKTSAREADYVAMLRDLRSASIKAQRYRDALTVAWYLGDTNSMQQLLDRVPPVDAARTLQSWGNMSRGEESHAHLLRAANTYQSLGLLAHAAICQEQAGEMKNAQELWSRLSESLVRSGEDYYAAGLARFNLSRCCARLEDHGAARSAVVSAVHLLEEAADRYEHVGQRERAFDCYQVLIAIGKQTGELEHVLEGYVNVVRILREDNLRYYALQSYEQALEEVVAREEYSAAATLAREMAEYANAQGMAPLANHATKLQAEMWRQVAHAALKRGSPAEVAENALLAAVVCCAKQHQFQTVGELYKALAELNLEDSRKKHYARASQRYVDVANAQITNAPLPAHLRNDADYPEVWHVDLVEWEQRGSASAACAEVVLDREAWTEVTRRRAMVARMQALQLEEQQHPPTEQRVLLIQMLGQVELYSVLSSLEHTFNSPHPQVRLAVTEALERFMYKRSFVTLRRALTDDHPPVRERAHRTLEALRFPHAFDPLARIVRESDSMPARAAALRAIARIDTREAAELMLGVFQHHTREEQAAALAGLKRGRGRIFLDVAREAWPTLDKNAKAHINAVFKARGISR